MTGRNTRMPWMTPHRLTPSTHCQAEIGPSQGSALLSTPALLHTRCTAPNRSTAAIARVCTDASSLTSVRTASVCTPSAAIFRSASSRASCSTSARTMLSPARAKRSASAKPMPLAAPVTTAVLPEVSSMAVSPPSRPASRTLHALPQAVREQRCVGGEQLVDHCDGLADGERCGGVRVEQRRLIHVRATALQRRINRQLHHIEERAVQSRELRRQRTDRLGRRRALAQVAGHLHTAVAGQAGDQAPIANVDVDLALGSCLHGVDELRRQFAGGLEVQISAGVELRLQ